MVYRMTPRKWGGNRLWLHGIMMVPPTPHTPPNKLRARRPRASKPVPPDVCQSPRRRRRLPGHRDRNVHRWCRLRVQVSQRDRWPELLLVSRSPLLSPSHWLPPLWSMIY